MKVAMMMLLFSFSSFALELKIKDYNWTMTDIATRGLTKEALFSKMDRDFVKPKSSICSNRAHMWANDFKRKQNLDTAKIFLFYTKKKGDLSIKDWWYHVSPVVNENGALWVMDAGFSGWINKPLSKEEWLHTFAESNNCKEISSTDTELIELIFAGQVFPHRTAYGYYDCYYKVVPHGFWTPETVAENLLGRNSQGTPVRVERDGVDKNELYQACLEATTGKLGWALGGNKKVCKEYVGY